MKKYRQVLYLMNIPAREELIARMTADCLKEAGLAEEVIIGQAYEIIFHIYDYEPDLVISSLPRDEYSTAMYTMVKLVYQCLWIVIHPEGFVPMTPEVVMQLIGFNRQPEGLADYVFFWGPGLEKAAGDRMLELHKISDRSRVKSFGYLLYEKALIKKYAVNKPLTDRIIQKKKSFRKAVLFVSVYVETNIIKTSGPASKESDRREWQRVHSNLYYMDNYIDLMYETATNNPDILTIIKLHPVEISRMKKGAESPYDRIRGLDNTVIIDEYVQISELFELVDVLVHYGSTTALEAYIYGVPTIGIINDHPDVQINSLGRPVMYADYKYKLGERDKIGSRIREDIPPRRNEETENVLLQYMNYRTTEPYLPSKRLISLISEATEPQRISIEDPEVRKALRWKSAIKRRVLFRARMLIDYLRGNAEEGRRIRNWLGRYGKAVHEGACRQ